MKLLFAADLHGSLSATEMLLQRFEQSDADWLILLGDLLNHGPRNALPADYQPAEVAERLNQYAADIIAVRGNCDSEVDQMLLAFPITAPWQQVLCAHRRLFLTHGHLYHPAAPPALRAGDVLVYGHTHVPQAERQGEVYCFNPGSVAIPKGGFPASYGLLQEERLCVMGLADDQLIAEVRLAY